MQAAQSSAAAPVWPQPGAVVISDEIAAARRQMIRDQFAAIDFIPDRPAASVLEALSKLHYSQFPVDANLHTKQVTWIPIRPANNTHDNIKARRIFCVRRPDNTLEALMPVRHVLKNPNMKTGRFAYKVIFSPENLLDLKMRPAFLLTAVYPAAKGVERDRITRSLFDREVNLRLHLNNLSSHFPKLENWGFKQGRHSDIFNRSAGTVSCQKVMMEDECLELNLTQYFDQYPYISEKEITCIIIRVLEALEKMYQGGSGKGFVHCDVKRDNIILKRHEGKWIAYLTDVGLSELIGSKTTYYNGTPKEWPPEYFDAAIHRRDIQYTESFDLWNVGILAWDMLHKVHAHSQWNSYTKAQYNLAFAFTYPQKFDPRNPSFDIDVAFLELYRVENYGSEHWKKEKADFLTSISGKSYTYQLLFDWLKKKWREEAKKFEASVAQQHPTLLWLQGLLRLDPAQRSIQQTLQQLREYHASLPDITPAQAALQAPPSKPAAQAPSPPQGPAPGMDEVAQSVHAMLQSEVHTKLYIPPQNTGASRGWWGWLAGWGKDTCTLQ